MSSGRFEYTEPLRIVVTNGEAGLQESLSEFGAVRPDQTPSKHCDEVGSWPER